MKHLFPAHFPVLSVANLLQEKHEYFFRTHFSMKRFLLTPVDLSKVETLVYHLPDGPTFSVEMTGLEDVIDIGMEMGDICDTSDIDGVLHFFPRGNA
ncbi:MAG: hypothetical protein RBS95_09090 [Desulfobulbus sp.]|nr:hypothetical protein [Desulfobulbus sp.]